MSVRERLRDPALDLCDCESSTEQWEAAYLRFETPEEEIQKFGRRLLDLGAQAWPRDAEIVELFCGRGNGLHALAGLGFTRLEGVDLSRALVTQYAGPARCYVADCRRLPFPDRSKDILIIQGGLHHLPRLPEDLEQTLSEARRVLRENGFLVVVEPWLTPFLRLAHAACRSRVARRLAPKVDALATMIRYEGETYEEWLARPETITGLLQKYFQPRKNSFRWGKVRFLGLWDRRSRDGTRDVLPEGQPDRRAPIPHLGSH
jgi:SAM-dependent methyltransferase